MMRKKTASQIFGEVDPKLKVIGGGVHATARKGKLRDWEQAGGALCPRCQQEAVRFRPEDGVCLDCARVLNEKQESEDKKRARQLKVIKQHNARIDRQKRLPKR